MSSLIIFYIFLIFCTTFLSLYILHWMVKRFAISNEQELRVALAFPLILFSSGFVLRLTADQGLVDAGFYFTEFSYIFVYTLFTLSLLLGQYKYYKVQSRPRQRI